MNTRGRIALVLNVAWILLILGFTLQNGESSANTSRWFVDAIHRILLEIDLPVSLNLLTTLVRKGAHFGEYAVLGWISSKNAQINKNKWFYLSALLPILDETLQTQVEGRAGQFSDVLIDLSGYLLGYLMSQIGRKNARYRIFHVMKG